jgi:hypothetical protein
MGGNYCEILHVSNEIIRMTIDFLLGVSKVVKEASVGTLNDPGQLHLRTVSFDDEEVPCRTPEVDRSSSRRSQDGRRSVES